MSNIDSLPQFAEFQAARAINYEVGSGSHVFSIDLTQAPDKGPEHPFFPWRLVEHQGRSHGWATPTDTDIFSASSQEPALLFMAEGHAKFFANIGDFAELDESKTPEGQIRRQIRGLRVMPFLTYRERLASRLEFLLDAMKEERETWKKDSPDSLRNMLLFLQSVRDFQCPMVTVTPSATYRAQWTIDPSRHFAVDFLPNGQTRFVVFCPDPRHSERVQRVSGMTSWENLMTVIEPYKVHRWAADAGP